MERINEPLTPALIEQLKRKGYNQSEIARMFGVTRQHVSAIKHRSGFFTKSPRETMLEHYPWDTSGGFSQNHLNHRMLDHGNWIATNDLSLDRQHKLLGFYRKLAENDYVVEFNPDFPPEHGIQIGGFCYVRRLSSDGDLMIRVNKHTTLTHVGETLWAMPERRDWPSPVVEDRETEMSEHLLRRVEF